jgi:hypothetical protein
MQATDALRADDPDPDAALEHLDEVLELADALES